MSTVSPRTETKQNNINSPGVSDTSNIPVHNNIPPVPPHPGVADKTWIQNINEAEVGIVVVIWQCSKIHVVRKVACRNPK